MQQISQKRVLNWKMGKTTVQKQPLLSRFRVEIWWPLNNQQSPRKTSLNEDASKKISNYQEHFMKKKKVARICIFFTFHIMAFLEGSVGGRNPSVLPYSWTKSTLKDAINNFSNAIKKQVWGKKRVRKDVGKNFRSTKKTKTVHCKAWNTWHEIHSTLRRFSISSVTEERSCALQTLAKLISAAKWCSTTEKTTEFGFEMTFPQ